MLAGTWPIFKDPDGVLAPIEFNKLPFRPRRIFYVSNIPKGEERGKHAHYNTKQILTCMQGEILVKLHDGSSTGPQEHILYPNDWIFVDKLVWDSQVFLTGEDILMAICSTTYKKIDYIEDFDKFLQIVRYRRRKNK